MIIRESLPSDTARLRQIYLECRRETFHWVSPDSFKITDFDKDTEGEWTLVAEEKSKILGFSSVWVQSNFLHHLFVTPIAQGNGIGRALLTACLSQKLKTPARLKCVVQNTKACRFYESRGWSIESTASDGPMGPYHNYLLESTL